MRCIVNSLAIILPAYNEELTISATGAKPHYYSLCGRAADFGYAPLLTAFVVVLHEAKAILHGVSHSKASE
jgi:hypothetical protein